MSNWSDWLRTIFRRDSDSKSSRKDLSLARAQELIAAIDRGGIPLSPIIVNCIGRDLGLKVLPSDPMSITIERIRAQLHAID